MITDTKERIIAKICPKCGTENLDSARFCMNCGAPLTEAPGKKGTAADKGTKTNSYLLLTLSFLVALFLVLLILKRNAISLEKKVAALQTQTSEQEMPSDHPSMEKMAKIQAIKDSLKTNPNDARLLTELANNYFDIGLFDLAIPNYKRALAFAPSSVEVLIDLGVAYFNTQKLDSALFFVDKALSVQPNHRLALFNKGVIQFNMGNFNGAVKSWETLVKLYPNSREAASAREFIKQAKEHLKNS